MRKILIFIFYLSLSLFFIQSNIYASDVTVIPGEHIRNINSQITVNQDGTINIKETIMYDFADFQKHGIYREIPYMKVNQDGKKYLMSFEDFRVTDEAVSPYNFTQTDESEKIKLKIGDPDKTITGLHTYIISYKVSGALTYFSDHDELYWNVTGIRWIVPITSVTSEVTMPVGIGQNNIKAICYTGVSGSREQNCSTAVNGNIVTAKTNNVLDANQGLTVVVSFPKGMVAVLEPKEYVSFWGTFFGKLLKSFLYFIFYILSFLWYVFLPLFIPIRWWLAGRDTKPPVGETTAWYDPPKTKNGRFLTPGETGTLIDEKADVRDISAMIIDLARRGYLKIIEKKKKEFSLTKVKETDEKLMFFEREFLTDIFAGEDEFLLANNKMYEIAESVKNSFYDQLVSDGSFPKNPKSVRNFYYTLAVLGFFTGNLHFAVITFIFAGIMPKKTLLGAEQLAVAKSLKNFLTSQERQLKFQADKQIMFEKLLPYAVAFGVEKIWANRFKDLDLKQPDWYQGYYGSNFTAALFISSLNSSFSKMSSAAMTPTRSSSGFSSGFSGGGFSGGGGGGGGGSW